MMLKDQLTQILQDLMMVKVESAMMLGAMILLVSGLVSKKKLVHKAVYAATLLVTLYLNATLGNVGLILSKGLYVSAQSIAMGALILLVLLATLLFPRSKKHSTEFYFLMLSMGVGVLFMMKANSLLLIYITVELVSYVSYILTSFSFRKSGHEAAIKYLLFGAVSSGMMLLGLGLVYGTAGSFYISDWDFTSFTTLLSQAGLLFLVFGLLFKISIFPFHIWTPAVYQTAPNDAAAILSIVPKIGGIVLLKRLLINTALPIDHWILQAVIWLGIATILIGTLGGLRQSNTRRMISFGAIAHSGFLLPFAFITGNTSDEAFWWYAFVYAIMNIGVFYFIDVYEKHGVTQNHEYAAFGKYAALGAGFTLVLISLAGLPPLAGFTAKFFLFSTLWEAFNLTGAGLFLTYLVVAVVATVVSLFFYLRIPYQLFLSKSALQVSIVFSSSTKFIATIFAIALLLLFFVPKLVVMIHHLLIQHP